MSRRLLRSLTILVSTVLLTVPGQAQTGEAAAQALYEEAVKADAAGDHVAACPKLEEVVKLVPQGVGARLTLARCYEALGRLASAHASYALAEGLASSAGNAELQRQAHDGAAALVARLARLTVVVPDGLRGLEGLDVQRDGVPVRAAQWAIAIPVDRGPHRIVVAAPGKLTWEKSITVEADGQSLVITLEALAAVPTPAVDPPVPPPVPAPRADAPTPPPVSLSHRRQFGAVLRADLDGQGRGVVAAPGLSYGAGDYVDVTAVALLGRDKGIEPGATALLLRGAWRPRLSLAVPIFFVDGVRPGVRAAAGVQWDPLRHLGVFVDAGVALFPTVPNGSPSYQNVVFVPSVGLQPRL